MNRSTTRVKIIFPLIPGYVMIDKKPITKEFEILTVKDQDFQSLHQ